MFQKAVQLAPRSSIAQNQLGQALERKGDRAGARKAYEQAVDSDPRNGYARNNLGSFLLTEGKRDEAAVHLRKAVEYAPGIPEAYLGLAGAIEAKEPEEAIQLYRKAIELRPKYASAYNNLGNLLINADRLDEAIPALEKAI
jgi:superkiller protein 3